MDHVACMVEVRNAYKMLLGKNEWVTLLLKMISSIQVSLGTDGRITLKYNFGKWDVRFWTALKWPKMLFSGALL
jgi:hypothetical protein